MDDTDQLVKMGMALRQRHRWRTAEAYFKRATMRSPRCGLAWFLLAATRDQQGRERTAIPAYRKALSLQLTRSHRSKAWAWLGSSLRKCGRPKEALKCFVVAKRMGYPATELHQFKHLAVKALRQQAKK